MSYRDYAASTTSVLQRRIEAISDRGQPLWLTEALQDPTRKELRFESIFTIDPLNSRVRLFT